ncbi:transcription initiation factor TFIID subunit 4b-like [Carex rostrata]
MVEFPRRSSRLNEVGEMRETSGQNLTLENKQIEQGKVMSDQNKMVGGNPDVSTKLPISHTQTQTRLKMTNPQAQGVNPVSASKKTEKVAAAPTIPFHLLMPILRPHLDKDRDMQLQQNFSKLRSGEVSKEDFLKVIRNIVGDKLLRQAAHTVHLQLQPEATKPATSLSTKSSTSTSTGATSNFNPSSARSTNPNQYSLRSQATSQQFYPGGFQAAKKVPLGQSPSPTQLQIKSKLEPKGQQSIPNRPSMVSPSMQKPTRPLHQHGWHDTHTTIGMFAPSFPRPGNPTPSLRTPTSQSQGRGPGQVSQQNWRNVKTTFGPSYVTNKQPETVGVGTLQQKQTMGAGPAPTRDEFLGKLLPQRGHGPGTGITGPACQVLGTGPQMTRAEFNMPRASSGPQYPLPGLTKAPSMKPYVGQKKPVEAYTSPPTSKKQKTGGAFLDQSIEKLNDVAAVSGVNLRVMLQSQIQTNADVGVEPESESTVVRQSQSQLRKESRVWIHFDEVETKVACKHCSMEFVTNAKSGTTHLHCHINVCQKNNEEEKESFALDKCDDLFDTFSYIFDPELTRSLMALLFIDTKIPFDVIESRYWEPVMRSLRPEYRAIGRQPLINDCVEEFKAEIEVSLKEFEGLDSCVSFTSDIWTSSVNLDYLCITSHYIDKSFNFKKKITSFKQIPYPHTGLTVASLIEKILIDWKLDGKIFTITRDNCLVNDNAIRCL